MAHRIKCKECNSCLSPMWVLPHRYYYCGFCRQYYGGTPKNLEKVESPFKEKLESGKIEDPILE